MSLHHVKFAIFRYEDSNYLFKTPCPLLTLKRHVWWGKDTNLVSYKARSLQLFLCKFLSYYIPWVVFSPEIFELIMTNFFSGENTTPWATEVAFMDWLSSCQTEGWTSTHAGRELKCVLEKFAYINIIIDTAGGTDQYWDIKQEKDRWPWVYKKIPVLRSTACKLKGLKEW